MQPPVRSGVGEFLVAGHPQGVHELAEVQLQGIAPLGPLLQGHEVAEYDEVLGLGKEPQLQPG